MTIGIAWAEGSFADASFATGAWNQTLSPPVFSGTIPNITGNEGDPNIVTDLSTYFTGATSYSISPAVEAGWTFDTVTGILTVDTDIGTFGPYTVTGTNASGSDDSNAFSVIISAESQEQPSGGWFWFRYEQEQLRRKELRRQQEERKKKAKEIKDNLEKQIALEFRKKEQEKERLEELKLLTDIVEQHKEELERIFAEKVLKSAERAIKQRNYSAMEALEREIKKTKEEEEFLIEATRIILNG